jgi:hypothetical protein
MATRTRAVKLPALIEPGLGITPVQNPISVAETRRIVPTVDLVSATQFDEVGIAALLNEQHQAATHFYANLQTLQNHFEALVVDAEPMLPQRITGNATQPDGSAAAHLVVTADAPPGVDNTRPWPNPSTTTDANGLFVLAIPAGTRAKDGLTLRFKGAHSSIARTFKAEEIGTTGILGTVNLGVRLEPLPQSIVGSLIDLVSGEVTGAGADAPATTTQATLQVKMGTDDCPLTFYGNQSVDRFPYGVLIRLVEPRTSVLTRTFKVQLSQGSVNLALRNAAWAGTAVNTSQFSFTDRIPVDQPISVDGFRDRIVDALGAFARRSGVLAAAGAGRAAADRRVRAAADAHLCGVRIARSGSAGVPEPAVRLQRAGGVQLGLLGVRARKQLVRDVG